jgi:hypothetical protein
MLEVVSEQEFQTGLPRIEKYGLISKELKRSTTSYTA